MNNALPARAIEPCHTASAPARQGPAFPCSRLPHLIRMLVVVFMVAGCASRPAPEARCPTRLPCPACPVCPAPTATPPGAPKAPDVSEPEVTHPPFIRSDWHALPEWANDRHAEAWPALLQSCQVLSRRSDWSNICTQARQLGPQPGDQQVRHFLETHLQPWQAIQPDGGTQGLITGYYEPLIRGNRHADARYPWPIHARPRDMLTIELTDVYPDLQGRRLRGRVVGDRVLPYWTRGEIGNLGANLPAEVLLWAEDPIELFFLQVQGSGQVELPNGQRVRIGYAEHNGHPYQSIGRWLVAQGELTLDQASMQGIKQWARKNPHRLHELLAVNPSYVFFREMPAGSHGPLGAMGVPLTAERSLAVDPAFVPLGAPVFLSTTYPNSPRPLHRLMMAQDTGGAIKGIGRGDFFWGFGASAGTEAGRMRQQGRMWVLLPHGVT
ncbi:MAG: MltA domain-containing protein, partial [Rhodocyclaceae bacterium]|nr:MltA domain-containing protein [Rhodocyclaceae bacterium]